MQANQGVPMKPKQDGSVKISNLVKTYTDDRGRPTFTAVKNINLEIKDGEFMVLVGPSGCGKSTTLRMVAGLEKISSGTIAIGGKVVNDLEPNRSQDGKRAEVSFLSIKN
jgi:multiple sugar transport system ATP-binding protein